MAVLKRFAPRASLLLSLALGPAMVLGSQTPLPAPPPVAPSYALAGIAHVAFRTQDLQASLEFYNKLGFVRAFELTRDGKPSEEFIKINDRQFIELYPVSSSQQTLGLMHVCYEAANLEALDAAYANEHLNPPPVKKAAAGNLLFNLRGPDQQVIEFTQYMPGSMHSNDRGVHLGQDRVSTLMTGVVMPVQDPVAWTMLFQDSLHFVPEHTPDGLHLALPSDAAEFLAFRPQKDGAQATIQFSVGDLQAAARKLRDRGVAFQQSKNSLLITAPDHDLLLEFTAPQR